MPVLPPLRNESEIATASLELLDQSNPNATWGALGKPITGWTRYSITNDFFSPMASFELEIVAEVRPGEGQLEGDMARIQKSMQNGEPVGLRVNGKLVSTGYVDQINIRGGAHGTVMLVRGRDALSIPVDSYVDPHFQFPEGQTLKAFLLKLFSPYGFKDVVIGDRLNRQKMTGAITQLTINEQHKVFEKQITTPINSKFKAQVNEGIYEFAERIGRRYGFRIWCGADGKTIHIGGPDYDHPPVGALLHKLGDGSEKNNILDYNVTWDWHKQPSAIIASGTGKGGPFPYGALRTLMVNELLCDDDQLPKVQEVAKEYKVKPLTMRDYIERPKRVVPVTKYPRIHYVKDDESKEQAHLDNYTRRLMADAQSHFLVAEYTVAGHGQNGNLWAPNTMVQVEDDVSRINGQMWIRARTFSKERDGGTTTKLTCILPYVAEVGQQGD